MILHGTKGDTKVALYDTAFVTTSSVQEWDSNSLNIPGSGSQKFKKSAVHHP